jgi:hypothetical protein
MSMRSDDLNLSKGELNGKNVIWLGSERLGEASNNQ